MQTDPTTRVIEHLRRTVVRDGAGFGDGELLGRFVELRDESAFDALLERHGPMVWGVCRRLLSHHDAEDAFQATFLILVRKAASVVPREMVGNWLYGVARLAALQARRAARRRAKEVQVVEMPDAEARPVDRQPDAQPLLDQELTRLPEMYRAVLVLCDLEGRTRIEVARQLGVPEGTVAGRLARARTMLAKRLARRGVAPADGASAAVLAESAASAGVPASLVSSTIGVTSRLAEGRAAVGAVSPTVAALTERVLKVMLMSKLGSTTIVVALVVSLVAAGATVLTCRTAAGQGEAPTVRGKVGKEEPPEPEQVPITAWGKAVGGLKAGLGYKKGGKRVYRHGETVALVVRVRNVGKEAVKFSYFSEDFSENPPLVSDGKDGSLPRIGFAMFSGLPTLNEVDLAPGKEVELCEMSLALAGGARGEDRRTWTLYGTGKFRLRYDKVGGNITQKNLELLLSKLATGKLELEVKAGEKIPEKKGASTD